MCTGTAAEPAQPLITQFDRGAPKCSATFPSLADFRAKVPAFEAHGQQLTGDARSIFTVPDLRRYDLRRPLPASGRVAMPEAVRQLLGWNDKQAAWTVGAYPTD